MIIEMNKFLQLIETMKQELAAKYAKLEELLIEDHLKLSPLVEKNLRYHERQLTFIEHAIDDTLLGKLDASIHRYDRIIMELIPNGGSTRENLFPTSIIK